MSNEHRCFTPESENENGDQPRTKEFAKACVALGISTVFVDGVEPPRPAPKMEKKCQPQDTMFRGCSVVSRSPDEESSYDFDSEEEPAFGEEPAQDERKFTKTCVALGISTVIIDGVKPPRPVSKESTYNARKKEYFRCSSVVSRSPDEEFSDDSEPEVKQGKEKDTKQFTKKCVDLGISTVIVDGVEPPRPELEKVEGKKEETAEVWKLREYSIVSRSPDEETSDSEDDPLPRTPMPVKKTKPAVITSNGDMADLVKRYKCKKITEAAKHKTEDGGRDKPVAWREWSFASRSPDEESISESANEKPSFGGKKRGCESFEDPLSLSFEYQEQEKSMQFSSHQRLSLKEQQHGAPSDRASSSVDENLMPSSPDESSESYEEPKKWSKAKNRISKNETSGESDSWNEPERKGADSSDYLNRRSDSDGGHDCNDTPLPLHQIKPEVLMQTNKEILFYSKENDTIQIAKVLPANENRCLLEEAWNTLSDKMVKLSSVMTFAMRHSPPSILSFKQTIIMSNTRSKKMESVKVNSSFFYIQSGRKLLPGGVYAGALDYTSNDGTRMVSTATVAVKGPDIEYDGELMYYPTNNGVFRETGPKLENKEATLYIFGAIRQIDVRLSGKELKMELLKDMLYTLQTGEKWLSNLAEQMLINESNDRQLLRMASTILLNEQTNGTSEAELKSIMGILVNSVSTDSTLNQNKTAVLE